MCQWLGARLVWAMSNFIVFACMAGTAIISLVSVRGYSEGIQHVIGGSAAIRTAALVLFALLGFPLAVSIFSLHYYLICLHFCPQKYVFAGIDCLCVADYIQCSIFSHSRVDCWFWWRPRFVTISSLFLIVTIFI